MQFLSNINIILRNKRQSAGNSEGWSSTRMNHINECWGKVWTATWLGSFRAGRSARDVWKPNDANSPPPSSTMSSSVSSSPIPLEFEFDVAQQTTPISEETSPEPLAGTSTAASSPPPNASSEYSFASSELAEVCIYYLKHAQCRWITTTC
jgi:hypothetical protein